MKFAILQCSFSTGMKYYLVQKVAQFFLALQVSKAGSVGAAHIHYQVVSERAQCPHSLHII